MGHRGHSLHLSALASSTLGRGDGQHLGPPSSDILPIPASSKRFVHGAEVRNTLGATMWEAASTSAYAGLERGPGLEGPIDLPLSGRTSPVPLLLSALDMAA